MTSVNKTVEVEIDIDLEEFEDGELIEEIESRGYDVFANPLTKETVDQVILELHKAYTTGKYYEHILSKLFDKAIGRIV